MRVKVFYLCLILLPCFLFSQTAPYDHDRWGTLPRDLYFEFDAFVLSFDGEDDDDGDGLADLWGIPEWVAFEIRARETAKTGATPRPRWTTDPELYVRGIAPGDETYAVPGTAGLPEVKTDYRFVRGHMCPKETAERISPEAGRETHTLLNAVPQLQWQNNGIWKELESLCLDWADKYGRLWVVCGPVFFGGSPSLWLGQGPEKRAAVPDALFKIVIRETPGGPDGGEIETLAFLIPNILPKEKKNPGEFLTSIQRIEGLAGLRFFSHVPAYPLENKSRPGDLRGW